MVLVFGIEVPLIELNIALAVINIILMVEVTIVLIVIMYQLRMLRRLGIAKSSDFEKKIPRLEQYLKNSVKKGLNKHEIIKELIAGGWSSKETRKFVEEYFESKKSK